MFKKLLATLLLVCGIASATISSSMIFEVRTTGDNTYPGCFKEGASGTDFTMNAGSYTFTDLVIDGATNTKVTSASHNFVAADVGNCMRINSGSGFTTGVFEIVSVAANAATLDRSAGTLGSTGGTYHVGGQLATWAQLNTDMCSGCRAYVKATAAYSVGTGITLNYTNTTFGWIEGYTTTRGDGGQVTIQASAGITILSISMSRVTVRNIILDANSQANSTCLSMAGQVENTVYNMECKNTSSSSTAVNMGNLRQMCIRCYIHNIASSGNGLTINGAQSVCQYCVVATLTGSAHTAILLSEGQCLYCVIYGNTVAGSDGFSVGGGNGYMQIDHCVVYNVARDAIRITNAATHPHAISNCILSTATNGVNNSSGTTIRAGDSYLDYNWTYNLSGTAYTSITAGSHGANLSADPFTAVVTPDFTLNNTAGGGATVRAAGAPATFLGLSTGTGYPDPGVFQHADSGGSTVGGFVAP